MCPEKWRRALAELFLNWEVITAQLLWLTLIWIWPSKVASFQQSALVVRDAQPYAEC